MSEFYEAVRLKMKIPIPAVPASTDKKRNYCWPWSHEWTKWKTIETGHLDIRDETGKPLFVTGNFEIQHRVCETCGMSQLRKATT
jgi:hypothetical protein